MTAIAGQAPGDFRNSPREGSRARPSVLRAMTRGIQVTPVQEKKQEFMRQLGSNDMYYPDRLVASWLAGEIPSSPAAVSR